VDSLSEGDELGAYHSDLFEYLQHKLLGSSLTVVLVSPNEISIESGDTISLKIKPNPKKKILDFAIFSKTLNRPVTVEEINGSTFMETRMEEELQKEDRILLEEDILLSVDLIRLWAKENHYTIANDGLEEKPKTKASK
jgi:hypothetical protein